jgi:hypothetical protein
MASFLYSYVGYMYTFIIFGAFLITSVIPIIIFLPKDKNYKHLEDDSSKKNNADNRTISYLVFIKNKCTLLTLIACTVIAIFLYFTDSIYSVYLASEFEIGPNLVGYVYIPPLLVYIILCT